MKRIIFSDIRHFKRIFMPRVRRTRRHPGYGSFNLTSTPMHIAPANTRYRNSTASEFLYSARYKNGELVSTHGTFRDKKNDEPWRTRILSLEELQKISNRHQQHFTGNRGFYLDILFPLDLENQYTFFAPPHTTKHNPRRGR
jgi:hypothetical protein